MLTEETITTFDVDPYGRVNVERKLTIFRDGEPVAWGLPHNHVISPGDTVADTEHEEVKALVARLHTPENVAAFLLRFPANAPAVDSTP